MFEEAADAEYLVAAMVQVFGTTLQHYLRPKTENEYGRYLGNGWTEQDCCFEQEKAN